MVAPDTAELPKPIAAPVPTDPACWLGPAMLAARGAWTVDLSEGHAAELLAAVAAVEARGLAMADVTRADFPLPTLGPVLAAQVGDELEKGRGFALIRGLPVAQLSDAQARLALWGIGAYLGTAEKQDAAGLMMHDVRDIAPKAEDTDLATRMKNDSTIRGFQTNAALPYHTDGCDAFALACLKKGKTGGESLLISVPTVFNAIVAKRPDLAKVLQEPFHFDARGQREDGAECQVSPIFTVYQGRVLALHKEPYIHTAQRFESVPRLSELQKEALDVLRETMDSEELAMRFTLEPGEVVVASNHSTMHGRTAFDTEILPADTPESARSVRHMLRLWLTMDSGRPLPPHYADTREYCDTYERRCRDGPTVLDGSMGRLLLNKGLPSDGVLWSARALVDEQYHQMVVQAHKDYIEAGADMITTNNYAVQPYYYRNAFGAEWRERLVEHTRLAGRLARRARDECGRPEVKIMGCLPPLVDSHRPDLTHDAYLKEGQDFFLGVYKTIAEAIADDADVYLAETMSTTQEMLCAVRAAKASGKPVIVSMAATLRDQELKEAPQRAAEIVEFVLQEVEQGRADIPVVSFNCAGPEVCTRALAAIPGYLHERLRAAKVSLGVYPNLNRDCEKRQAAGWSLRKLTSADGQPTVAKIARREDMTDTELKRLCTAWYSMGASHIGACCGGVPDDIRVMAGHLKRHHRRRA